MSTETCQAAVFHGVGQPLELRAQTVPRAAAGEALVRVECCTICGSDLHTMTGRRQEPVPTILGHEIVGVVQSLGSPPLCDVDGVPLTVGERVTWSTAISCGECDRCQSGLPQKCRRLAKYGHERAVGRQALSGGLAEQILLRPGTAAVKLSRELPIEVICPVNCATATIAAAFRTGGMSEGRRVLIFGAGMLGLTAAAYARAHGAQSITLCDISLARLRYAEQFGADRAVAWSDDHAEFSMRLQEAGSDAFDLVLECSGAAPAVEAGCALADIGADVVLVGSVLPTRSVSLNPETLVRRWISIHGVHNYAPCDLSTAIEFLENSHQHFPFAGLIEQTYPLSEVNEAVQSAIANRPIRIAVRP